MDQTYRILLVEDELYDAELNIREVKKILPNSIFERVDSKNAFVKMIETYFPDIIISDYNMPSFDGLSALKIAREMCPETPFIIVTGSINEDTAVECMKAGATDYVLKESLKRLGSSVLNALEQSKIRKERIDAIDRLIHERKLLRTLIDNLPVTIYVKDAECRKIIANRADMEVIGAKTEEEVLGKTDMEVFSDDIGVRGYADDKKIIETGIPVLNQEEYFYDTNGIQHWLLTSKIPLTDENGKITGLVGIGHNITEQRKMQAELIEAKEKAEESDRLKSAFLANMSHEIRTPLNSIIGFSELLGDPDFDAEQKTEFIRHIVDNGNSLLMIISDIMDFSMLEAGQLKLRPQSISVKKIMNELLSEYRHKAEIRGIQLRFDDSKNDPDVLITSDLYRIKQVFNNLIGNALKFTSEGFVEIGYKEKGESIEFHVKDSGIGISPKFHQAIFERFRQVDTTKSRKFGGNGLGLAISKNLVQLLGGKIWLESEPDKYSDFFFTIPI